MRSCLPVTMLACLVGCACLLQADRISGSSIVRHSPFLPSSFNPPDGAGQEAGLPASPSQFQFKGVYQLDGEYFFHIFDEGSHTGKWIAHDVSMAGFPRVLQFQESENLLLVEVNGERMHLVMIPQSNSIVPSTTSRPDPQNTNGRTSAASHATGNPSMRRPVIRSTGSGNDQLAVRRVTFPPQPINN